MALIKLSSNYRQFFPRNYIARELYWWNGAIIEGISVVRHLRFALRRREENFVRSFYVISQPA